MSRAFVAVRVAAALAVLLGATLLLVHGGRTALAAAPRPRNVLLIVADTLRANRLGCYGYERATSPNIDRLARSGTLYRRNYSQACWTLPSMISLMTGRSVVDELRQLPPQPPLISEAAREAGLESAAFLTNQGLGPASGFQRGYDDYVTLDNERAATLAQSFVDWHAARTGNKRWFGWVHFIDPHEPYEPDAAHDLFSGPRLDQARIDEQLRVAQPEAAALSPDVRTPTLEQAIAKATLDSDHYDGEVRSVDDGVGTILAELERSGELADTLVIFCADHGDMLYEHRQQPLITQGVLKGEGYLTQGALELFGHGHRPWYYDDLWHTPLILAGPGIPANAERSELSANLDIFPTLLEALGLPPRAELEGTSLWHGRESEHERVFAHGHRTSAVVERGGLKLILHPPEMFLKPAGSGDIAELHDVFTDPREDLDLAERRPKERERLVQEILRWRERSPHYGAARTGAAQLDVLKKLGYVDGEH